jgi:hypothetical protein
MHQGFNNGCHGCGGKGWVSPNYGVAVKCPICGGSGQPSTITMPNVPIKPYTPIICGPVPPYTIRGKCPNAGNPCFCTGACMEYGVPTDWLLSNGYKKSDDTPPEQA